MVRYSYNSSFYRLENKINNLACDTTCLKSGLSVVYGGIPMMLAFLGEVRTGVEMPATQQHV